MKPFNIRKLKIYATNKEHELRRCNPKSRDRIRGELKALTVALVLAGRPKLADKFRRVA